MENRRVVLTGLGAITPIGKTVDETWEGIKSKKCGIDEIKLFDASDYKTKLDAEVKEYNPLDYFEVKQAKRFDRSSQFAIIAAREAVKSSGITKENTDFDRVRDFCKFRNSRTKNYARTM
ncbi:MAG: hypothetical protein HFH03_12000, partial [Dorea sp.]|nr:hypothetical protein [Dorea sp.]